MAVAPLRLTAITPTRTGPLLGDPARQIAQIEAMLGAAGFAGGVIRRMADYPPQIPPIGQAQSLGRKAGARTPKRTYTTRKGYRRTGTLGRNWKMVRLGRVGNDIVSEVSNAVPYTRYVQGPKTGPSPGTRQAAVMRARGWKNITDEAAAEWAIWRPRIVRILTQP